MKATYRFLFPYLIALAAPAAMAQNTFFVDDDALAGGDGSLSTPFDGIQLAIDSASSGDTILVQRGRYGDVNFSGKDLTLRSLEGAALTQTGTVTFNSGEGRSARFEGFEVTNTSQIAVLIDASSPTFMGNTVENQFGCGGGGAIRIVNGADPAILNNRLVNNFSIPGTGRGGAIFVTDSSAFIEGNLVQRNGVDADLGVGDGGGLYATKSTLLIMNNLFQGNWGFDSAGNRGGAIYASFSTLTLRGNTFTGNQAPDGNLPPPLRSPGSGGALYLERCTTTSLNDSYSNNRASHGSEIYLSFGFLDISYCNLLNGLSTIEGNGTLTHGEGLQNNDPLLDATFHLTAGSPLIDAGDPASARSGVDRDQDPRLLDGNADHVVRIDIGWDEFNPSNLVVNGDGSLGSRFGLITTGPARQNYILAASLGTADIPINAYGSLLLALPGLMVVGTGSVPGNDAINVPLSSNLVGQIAGFQALVRAPGTGIGSFTRRVRVALH